MPTSRPPKLLFVLNRVLGWRTYADALAGVVSARADIDAEILFLRPDRVQRLVTKRHRPDGPRRVLRRVDPISWYRGPAGRRIRTRIMGTKPEVVHFAGHWTAGAMASLPWEVPYTASLDCTCRAMDRALGEPGVWTARDFEREAELCRGAARLYPWSEWVAHSLTSDYGVAAERMRIVPPAIAMPAHVRHGGGEGPLRILFVGNDFLRKGGDRLLGWVHDRLAGRCELHIASSDPRAQLALPGVVSHGAVPNRTLREELMPQMDVLCHPTRSDMSAYVVVEAAAAGLPCVASAVGGIPDLVDDGRTGFLLAPDDDDGFVAALEALAGSRERLDEMGRAARDLAESRFDARAVHDELIDELASLAAERR